MYYLHPLYINLLQNFQEIDFLYEQLRCMLRKRGTIILDVQFSFLKSCFWVSAHQEKNMENKRNIEATRICTVSRMAQLHITLVQFLSPSWEKYKTRQESYFISTVCKTLVTNWSNYSARQHASVYVNKMLLFPPNYIVRFILNILRFTCAAKSNLCNKIIFLLGESS